MGLSSLLHRDYWHNPINKEFDAKIDRYTASSDDPGYLGIVVIVVV